MRAILILALFVALVANRGHASTDKALSSSKIEEGALSQWQIEKDAMQSTIQALEEKLASYSKQHEAPKPDSMGEAQQTA